ncbi:MAG: peptidase [Candidatus Binatia bacterium]
MTYCVGLHLRDGLVLVSDTRTNAGVDNVSTFGKMHVVENSGERVMALLTAGNLAITQSVVNLLAEGVEVDGGLETLLHVPTMFRAAQLVGAAVRQVWKVDGPSLQQQNISFDVSILLGGQIHGRPARLFQIYAAGNFIEATPESPFLQIGEHKYGKPILDRAVKHEMPIEDGIKLALISMDSTLRSNMSVGLPMDLLVLRDDESRVGLRRRIHEDDEYFRMIRERWSAALREAYRSIPTPDWISGGG